jgi:hypothetical protein
MCRTILHDATARHDEALFIYIYSIYLFIWVAASRSLPVVAVQVHAGTGTGMRSEHCEHHLSKIKTDSPDSSE